MSNLTTENFEKSILSQQSISTQ